jgi:hypothetical protein
MEAGPTFGELLAAAGFPRHTDFIAFVEARTGHRLAESTISRAAGKPPRPYAAILLEILILQRASSHPPVREDADDLVARFGAVVAAVGRHPRVLRALGILESEVARFGAAPASGGERR